MCQRFEHLSASHRDKVAEFMKEIPLRNVWLLMAYAARVDSKFGPQYLPKRIISESLDNDLPDLVGQLLASEVMRRFRDSLSVGYQSVTNEQGRVRGRIRHLETARNRSLSKGKIVVSYEILTNDNEVNRLARKALEGLQKLCSNPSIALECASAIRRLELAGVKSLTSTRALVHVQARDKRDLRMVSLAKLALNLQIPTQIEGRARLLDPQVRDEWIRKIYEKAVFSFYQYHLDSRVWKVEASKKLSWQIYDATPGFKNFLPGMRTDIEITNMVTGEKTVIDTKFTSITNTHFDKEKFKSGHLYQIYAYLRTQEPPNYQEDSLNPRTSGMLLYPTIDSEYNESASIQGHKLSLVTVDLSQESTSITNRLLSLFA